LGVRDRQELGIFLFTTVSRPALGPNQPLQWVSGVLFLGVKRPVPESDHFHLVRRSRMRGATPPFSNTSFMARYSVKAKGKLSLYLTFSFTYEYNFIVINNVTINIPDSNKRNMTGRKIADRI
jgi:hypothetical protein